MRTWYSTDQEAIDSAFGAFFEAESPIEAVRAAEPGGFDPELWGSLAAMGGAGMALPENRGGGGADLADLAVVARQLGRRLAPVPLIEHSVACRLLAAASAEPSSAEPSRGETAPTAAVESGAGGFDDRDRGPEQVAPIATAVSGADPGPAEPLPAVQSGAGPDLEALLGKLGTGERIATLTLRPVVGGRASLTPAGAVAGAVVGFNGADLVLDLSEPPASAVANTADLPLADRDLTTAAVIASGPEAARLWAAARAEWQALMATACAGLAARAIELAVAYVMERRQFGVPVGSFQAVQHGLAEAAVRAEGGRLLAHRAAWSLDAARPDGHRLAAMALVFGAESARFAADRSLQYHGGYGYSAEYDVQLYYRRAAGWPLQMGEPAALVAELADRDLGPRGDPGTTTGAAAGTKARPEATRVQKAES